MTSLKAPATGTLLTNTIKLNSQLHNCTLKVIYTITHHFLNLKIRNDTNSFNI